MTALQLDLFGAIETAETAHVIDALTCLRDSVPTALAVVIGRGKPRVDHRAPAAGGNWAYCVSAAGFRFEDAAAWWKGSPGEASGWDRTPANLITWADLDALLAADPRRAEIAAWADALPFPSWKPMSRPFELWPHPEQWNPDYIAGDRADPGWLARRHAWSLTLALLTDAITEATR